jgi:hypothetical protein
LVFSDERRRENWQTSRVRRSGRTRDLVIEAQLSQAIVANGEGFALIDPVTASYARQRVAVKAFALAVPHHFYIKTNQRCRCRWSRTPS